MSDETLSALYRQHLASRQVDRENCPSVEALEALVHRSGSEADRLRTLDHVMACPACRQDFDLLRTAGEAARESSPPRHRLPLALAASLVLVTAAALLWTLTRTGEETVRGAPAELSLLLPADGTAVTDGVGLVWRPVEGAFQYQVEVLDEDGGLRYRQVTRDTALTVPPDSLVDGKSYVWWVRADLTVAGERRSPLRRFTVTRP